MAARSVARAGRSDTRRRFTAIDQAETLFGEAARIAEQQGAAMLRLRTAVSTARLYLRLDRMPEGARQLEAAIAAIAEDDDGPDLREARLMATRLGTVAAVKGDL